MAKFKFRLEPILKMRKLRQNDTERIVAERIGHMLRARRQLGQVSRQIEQHYDTIRQAGLVGPIDMTALVGNRVYLNHLHQIRHTEIATLAQAQHHVDQAKKDLTEAKKQTDIMEKLRERAKFRFDRERQRAETVELDDLATAKYAWRQQTAGYGANE